MQAREGDEINGRNGHSQHLVVDALAVAKVLLWIAIGLTVTHVVLLIAWHRDWLPWDDRLYVSFFDLDEEESLGTWFSTLLLFLAGLLSLFHAKYNRTARERWHVCWWLLGIGFIVLSLDEVAGFHEFVNTVVDNTHWTTFGAGLTLTLGVVFLPFLLSLPLRTRVRLMTAGVIYVGGAVGIEWATIWYEDNDQLNTLAYDLWNAVEESMEMTGIVLYIYALLELVAKKRKGDRIELIFKPEK